MLTIVAADANELFIQASRLLLEHGTKRITRGLGTLETSDEICLTLTDPTKSIITLPPRHKNNRIYQYLEAEFQWFLSGSLDIAPILQFSTFWQQICNADQTINSNYGYYAFFQKNDNLSQFEWCLEKLKKDPFSRQAVINFNQPRHKYAGNMDFVCTMGQQFIRRQNHLDSVVWMRSNDLIYGLTFNLPWFTYLHQRLAEELHLPLGKYSHIASTLHVYKKHYSMLRDLAHYNITKNDRLSALKIWSLWQDFIHNQSSAFADKIPD